MTRMRGTDLQQPPNESPGTIAAQARHAIERRIATLTLAPGSVVSEREVAEAVGFGKAAVREALGRLAGTGLVAPRMGSGYLIAPLTFRGARSLFEMWRVVETASVEAVVRRAVPLLVGDGHTLDVGGGPVDTDPKAGFKEEDYLFSEVVFHVVIVKFGDNRWLQQTFESAMTDLERLLRFAHRLGADLRQAQAEHPRLLEALERTDGEAARKASLAHIGRMEQLVFDALVNSDVTSEVNLAATWDA